MQTQLIGYMIRHPAHTRHGSCFAGAHVAGLPSACSCVYRRLTPAMLPITRIERACPRLVLHKCSRAVRHLMGLMMADASRSNGLHAIVTRCAEQRVAASLRTVDAFSI